MVDRLDQGRVRGSRHRTGQLHRMASLSATEGSGSLVAHITLRGVADLQGTRVTAEFRATRRLHHDAPVQDHAKCRGIARAGGWLRQAISAHLFNLTLVAAVVELSRLGQDAVLTGAVHLALDHEWERGSTSGGDTRPAPEVADLGLAVAAVTTECAQRRELPSVGPPSDCLGVHMEECCDLSWGQQGLGVNIAAGHRSSE